MQYSPEIVFPQLLNTSSEYDEERKEANKFLNTWSKDFNFFEFLLITLKRDDLDENLYLLIPGALRICYRSIFTKLPDDIKIKLILHLHEIFLIPLHPSINHLLLLYRQMRASFVKQEYYNIYDQFYQDVISRISFDIDENNLYQLLKIIKEAIIDRYKRQLNQQLSEQELVNTRIMEYLSPITPLFLEPSFITQYKFSFIKLALKIFNKAQFEGYTVARQMLLTFFQNLLQILPSIQNEIENPEIQPQFLSFLKHNNKMLYSIIATDFDLRLEDTNSFVELAFQLLFQVVSMNIIEYQYLKPLLTVFSIHFSLLPVNQELISLLLHIITINQSDIQDLENNPMFFIETFYSSEDKTNSLDKTTRDFVISIVRNLSYKHESVISYLLTSDITEPTIFLLAHLDEQLKAHEMENTLKYYIDKALSIGFEQNYEIASLNLLISKAIELGVINEKMEHITQMVALYLSSEDPIIFNSVLFIISSILKVGMNFGESDNDVIERILEFSQNFPIKQADVVLFQYAQLKSQEDGNTTVAIYERLFEGFIEDISAISEEDEITPEDETILERKGSVIIALLSNFKWDANLLDSSFFEVMDNLAKGSKSIMIELFFDFATSALENGQEDLIQQFCALFIDALQNEIEIDVDQKVMMDSSNKVIDFLLNLLSIDQEAFDKLNLTETLYNAYFPITFSSENSYLQSDSSKVLSLLIQTTENIDIEQILKSTLTFNDLNVDNYSLLLSSLMVYHPEIISELTIDHITKLFKYASTCLINDDNVKEIFYLAFNQLFQIYSNLDQEYGEIFSILNTPPNNLTTPWPVHERFQAFLCSET